MFVLIGEQHRNNMLYGLQNLDQRGEKHQRLGFLDPYAVELLRRIWHMFRVTTKRSNVEYKLLEVLSDISIHSS